jgi:hypothetical protein
MTAKNANDVHRELGVAGLREHGDRLQDLEFKEPSQKAKGNGLDGLGMSAQRPFHRDSTASREKSRMSSARRGRSPGLNGRMEESRKIPNRKSGNMSLQSRAKTA